MYKDVLNILGETNVAPLVDFKQAWIGDKWLFPKSYEQYAEELGYGLLCNLFIVYLPWAGQYNRHPDSWFVQHQEMKSLFDYYVQAPLSILDDNEKELLKTAEPFAKSENGEFLFWDTKQEIEGGEMPIYFTDFSSGIFHAGNSLYDFIDLATGVDFKSVLKFYTNPLPLTFKPFNEIF